MHIDPALYHRMAAYNTWVIKKVYAATDQMNDIDRKLDRGGFIKSVHALLNHLLWADRAWIGRFTGKEYFLPGIGTELYDDYEILKLQHFEMCMDIEAFVGGLSAEWLAGSLEWKSAIDGATRLQPRWLCLTHLFNQSTYHRGQLSTYLTQSKIDTGTTDLVWMPDPAST